MDSTAFARAAYFHLLEQIATIQKRIIERKLLVSEFGDMALASSTIIGALGRAKENNERGDARDRAKLKELYEAVLAMEAVFEKNDEAEIADIAAAVNAFTNQTTGKK